ncbi:MAG: type II secretion system secretin GspD [Betaproteobacteria bacterium]|nr:type II secretion system secretin GspD [Betaproteobacteria bacterium]
MTRRHLRPETMHRGAAPYARAALLVALAGALALAGCATAPRTTEAPPPEKIRPSLQPEGLTPALAATAARVQTGVSDTPDRSKVFKGTGVMVNGQPPGGGLTPFGEVKRDGEGSVSLNFEGADIRDVIRNILGDILGQNYVIDPAVGGQVTIRTSSGLPRSALASTLETLLRMNGATMVYDDANDFYKIVPQGAAVRGNVTPMLGNMSRALPSGFSVQIVPLSYVSSREMLKILEPLAKDAQAVRADDLRNLLILSGTERELRHMMDTIALFDVDWMRGMSAGLFTLQSADVKTVGQEIEKLLGQRDANPLGGLIRIVPIERMNALLVVTPNPALIEKAREWIEKLDAGVGGEGVRFYVYNLQNSRAERVGPLLQQAFTGRAATPTAAQAPSLAPGTPAGTIVSPPAFQPQATPLTAPPTVIVQQPPPPPAGAAAAVVAAGAQGALGVVRNIQVVADKDNNTLLIVATPAEYAVIESALKKLDVAARQVMIEIVIAEVSLIDNFQFGVEWYFRNGANQAGGNFRRGTTVGNLFDTAVTVAGAGLAARVPGFNYLLAGAFPGGIQAAVSLLGTAANTKIVANPHVAALDNQRSTIKVGDRIPITQQTLVGGTTNAVTTTSQYIDTGVLVAVTPRINAGGLVTMDIQAEVSNPGDVTTAGEAPPINTRSLQSIVAVQSGDTLVMGGLIRDTKGQGSEGIPLLSKIPVIGGLFGAQDIKEQRSELVLFVTPRVVETQNDMRNIVEDLRKRMERLDELFPFPNRQDPSNEWNKGGFRSTIPPPGASATPENAAAEIAAAKAARETAVMEIAAAKAAQEKAAAEYAAAKALQQKAAADVAAAKAAQDQVAKDKAAQSKPAAPAAPGARRLPGRRRRRRSPQPRPPRRRPGPPRPTRPRRTP